MAKSHGVSPGNGEATCSETELNELVSVSFVPMGTSQLSLDPLSHSVGA